MKKYLLLVLSLSLLLFPFNINATENENNQSQENQSTSENSGSNENTDAKTETQEELKIKLEYDEIDLKAGATKDVTLDIKASSGKLPDNPTYKLESSDTNVVTVDKGVITALSLTEDKEATVTITVLASGSTVEAKTTVKVKVKKDETKEEKEIEYVINKLKISGATLSPAFDKNTKSYVLTVTDEKNFDISVEDYDKENVGYSIKGNTNSILSNDKLEIIVTDKNDKENKEKNKYTLTVKKEEKDSTLSSLKITGYAFDETFKKEVKTYTTSVPYEVTLVTVEYAATDSNSKVVVSNDKNLKVGGNPVNITVTNGDSKTVYTIYVTRSDKTSIAEKETSIISSSSSLTSSGNTSSMNKLDISKIDDPDTLFGMISITIASIILFVIGFIGIYFYVKTSPKKMKKEILNKKEEKEESPIVEVDTI